MIDSDASHGGLAMQVEPKCSTDEQSTIYRFADKEP